jgi:PIN domain nuclease of toxin-antitoxin system
VIVLDSYAVLALLRDEAAAAAVQELIESTEVVALTALGVAEMIDRLVRLGGVDPEEAALDVAQLGLREPLAVDSEVAIRAGIMRARHYHRTTRAVSLADCVAAAAATHVGRLLATADPHLIDMCVAEGVSVVALPDVGGRRHR